MVHKLEDYGKIEFLKINNCGRYPQNLAKSLLKPIRVDVKPDWKIIIPTRQIFEYRDIIIN